MYHICFVPGCFNNSNNSSSSYYHVYTKKRLPHLDKWKKACGVEGFPKNAVICSAHFRNEDFINPNNKAQGLKSTAIPLRNPLADQNPSKDSDECDEDSMKVDDRAENDSSESSEESSEPENDVKPPAPKVSRQGEIRYVGEIDEDALDCLPEVRRAFKVLKKALRQDKARLAMYQKRNSRLRDEIDLLKKVLDESEEDGRSPTEILEQILEDNLRWESKSTKQKFEPRTIEPSGRTLTIGLLGKISCRMCLRTSGEVDAVTSVFSPFAGENFLSDIIGACFGVRIEAHDFCTKICEDCLVKADVAWRMYAEFQSNRLAIDEFYCSMQFKKKDAKQVDLEFSDPNEETLPEHESIEELDLPADNPADPDPDSDSECYSLPDHPFFTEHFKPVYQCHLCEEQYERANSLEYHLWTNHHENDEPDHLCEFCSRFLPKRYMKTHLESHTGPRPVCPVCDRSFSNRHYLSRHMVVHAEQKPFACSMCDKTYTQSQALRDHMQRVHQAPAEVKRNMTARVRRKPSMSCPVCGEKFKLSHALISHVEESHPEHELDVFPCQLCDKQFITEAQLKTHRAINHSKREYFCDQCGEAFNSTARLSKHLEKHHQTEDP